MGSSYSVNKYNKLVRTNKITPSKNKSPNVNKRNGQLNVNSRRSPNVDRSGSSNVVRSSSSGVGSSSISLHAVPCLASPSLQLCFHDSPFNTGHRSEIKFTCLPLHYNHSLFIL
jgi:hypothetical protein